MNYIKNLLILYLLSLILLQINSKSKVDEEEEEEENIEEDYFYKEYDTLLNIAKKNLFNITDKINLTESDFEDEKQYIAIEPNKNSNTNKKEENKTIIYNCEKLVESINFMEKINLEDEQNIDLMITHPNGLIILFFSSYAIYYQYNKENKSLLCKKSISYGKKRFIDYILVDEKNFSYYIIDDLGFLYYFGFMKLKKENNFEEENLEMILQYIGKVSPPSCIAYLNNNILFIGSIKSNIL